MLGKLFVPPMRNVAPAATVNVPPVTLVPLLAVKEPKSKVVPADTVTLP